MRHAQRLEGRRLILPAMLSLDASGAAQVGNVSLDWRVARAAIGLALTSASCRESCRRWRAARLDPVIALRG